MLDLIFMERMEEIGKKDFRKSLEETISGLFYTSETDAPFAIFEGKKVSELTSNNFQESINYSPKDLFEERSFDEFFTKLTTEKDWFGVAERERAKKFSNISKIMKDNLSDLKVFRIGKIRIQLYIVGLDSENNLFGLKTEAVET